MKIKTQYYSKWIGKNEVLVKPITELTKKGFLTNDLTEKVLEEGPEYRDDFLVVGAIREPREIWILEPNQEVNVLTFDLDFLNSSSSFDPNNFYKTNREYFKEYEIRYKNGAVGRNVKFDLDKIREKNYHAIKMDWGLLDRYFDKYHNLRHSYPHRGKETGSILWIKWCFKEPVHIWCNLPNSKDNHEITTVEQEEELDLNKYRDSELDREGKIKYRVEHKDLRKHLFKRKVSDRCGICGKEYPVNLLVAAHIKKRAECRRHEKMDKFIVMPMCTFGCDDLYERGYISVKNGKVVANNQKYLTDDVRKYINKIENTECTYYNVNRKKYFLWHNKYHNIR